jgi:hypothetical protein
MRQFIETGENPQAVVQAYGDLVNIGSEFGDIDGRIQEVKRYKEKAEAMLNTSGEFIFSRQEFESGQAAIRNKMSEAVIQAGAATQSIEVNFTKLAKARNKGKRRYMCDKFFFRLLDEYVKANVMAATLQGGMKQNEEFKQLLDKHIRAAGGSKSEEVLKERMQDARETIS